MSNVTLTIGGRSFTVACADGEEHHVGELGSTINRKLASMGDVSGQSEPRMLLFAALLLADEVHELRENAEAAAGEHSAADAPPAAAGQLEEIAERLENLASALEGAGHRP